MKKEKKAVTLIMLLVVLMFAVFLLCNKKEKMKDEMKAEMSGEVNVEEDTDQTETAEFVKTEITEETKPMETLITEAEEDLQESEPDHYLILDETIKICEFGKYMGAYVEDGSDEFVDNVTMLVLENMGDQYIQMANVTVNGQYHFQVTTLRPGDRVMLLEKDRTAYEEGTEIENVEVSEVALFHEIPSMCEDVLYIECTEGFLQVSNVSGSNFPGGKLFFKTMLTDCFLGGITYFVTIPELEEGQQVKLSSVHFQEERSELLFVTYAK